MNQFTIRDIENLCGIKAHTLRIWEQRYNLCVARRKESLHRVYDNDDLKELLRISYLYHNGHKISRIAALSREEIHDLVQRSCLGENNYALYIHQLTEAGMDFDKEKFEKIVNTVALRLGLEKSISEVLFPFLERIGLLWMTNNVIPAQEHFVSHIIRKKIILAIDGIEITDKSRNMLLFAPEGEHHEIPLLAINYLFRKNNNYTTYLGVNVKRECIDDYLSTHAVDRLYVHILTHIDNCALESFVCALCSDYPDKQVIVSGPAIKCVCTPPSNLTVVSSLEDMKRLAVANSKY